MSHIFISYSRKDIEAAKKVVQALSEQEFEIWVDWDSIPKGEDWWEQIEIGIEGADAFIFLVSPDSVISEVCKREIVHAVKNGKRILPLVIHDVKPQDVFPEVAKRNWIFCREGKDDFNTAMEETRETIHINFEWLRYHTRLQVKAREWEQKKDTSRLLRGKELREAEGQLAKANAETEPAPTELQQLYISTSRKNEKLIRYLAITILIVLVGSSVWLAWPYIIREKAVPGQWVSIPAGSFIMGMDNAEAESSYNLCLKEAINKSNCETPEQLLDIWSGRQVGASLPGFVILDNEVTNAQYQQCIEAGFCEAADWGYEGGSPNKPATGLDWFQAKTYCEWLGGRLPTEGEWEKSARGSENFSFPWGDEWDSSRANLNHFGSGNAQSVVQYEKSDLSGYGIKNLAGNVQEWTATIFSTKTINQPFSDEIHAIENTGEIVLVVLRGGSWENEPSEGMAAKRGRSFVLDRWATLGFRCVCLDEKTCKSPWTREWIWFGNY